jgi:hypothetical protein
MMHCIGDAVFFQGAHDEFRVVYVVFDEHDEDGFANHIVSLQGPVYFDFNRIFNFGVI